MGGGAWHALLLVDTAAYDSIAPHSNNRKLSTKPGRNTGVSLYHYGMDGRNRPVRPVKQENRGIWSGHSSLPTPEASDFSRVVVHEKASASPNGEADFVLLEQGLEVLFHERLLLQERLGNPIQEVPVLGQDLYGLIVELDRKLLGFLGVRDHVLSGKGTLIE